jgi:predicted ATP-grasp superfamily ATP-dependent carboligase
MRVLIVGDSTSRTALGAARALGQAGWTVGVGAPRRRGLAAASRWVRHGHRIPSPEADLDAFVETTDAVIARSGYQLVFGADDASVLALSYAREAISARVPYAPHDVILRSLDKVELCRMAEQSGFRVPSTVVATDDAIKRWDGPAVVKPRLHWRSDRRDSGPRLEAVIVSSRGQAARRAAEIRAAGGEPLLQRVVRGRLSAFAAVVDHDGLLVAGVGQETERMWPLPTGISVRARTIPLDPELAKRVTALLQDLGWFGLAQVQFLIGDGGEPWLIDFNGRPYGSLALATAAGPNLMAIWASLTVERPVGNLPEATEGVRYQWLEGDLRRAWMQRQGGLIRDVWGCFRYAPGAVHSISRLDDPLPSVRYAAHLAVRAGKRLGRSSLGGRGP